MVIKTKKEKKASCKVKGCGGHCDGAIYFFGFIGAAIYYISISTGFWMGVLGFLKAMVWPLFVVLELLKFLGA